jgi:hypothetical protein
MVCRQELKINGSSILLTQTLKDCQGLRPLTNFSTLSMVEDLDKR